MRINKDLAIAAALTLGLHAVALVASDMVSTPVEYDMVRAQSSVEVTLVKRQKEETKKPEEKKTIKQEELPEPEQKVEPEPTKPPKKPEKPVVKEKPAPKIQESKEPEHEPIPKEVAAEHEPATQPETRESEPVDEELKEELAVPVEELMAKRAPETAPMEAGTPVEMPAYLNNQPPRYPNIARQRGYEGMVILRVQVLANGNPSDIEIIESSGHRILDEAAYNAVEKWKFKPATRGGRSIQSWVEIPVRFKLEDR